MGANPDFLTCPVCNTSVSVKIGQCSQCHFALPVEGGRPTHFRFPEVPNAYIPSGKWTLPAVLLALACALPGGAAGGALLIFAHYFFLTTVWAIRSGTSSIPGIGLLFVVVILAGHLLLTFIPIVLVMLLLRWTTHTAKLRNPQIERAVGIAAGVTICLVYTLLGFGLPMFREGLEGSQPLIFSGFALLGFAVILYGFSQRATIYSANEPFCEDCQVFMKQRNYDRFPTRNEDGLLKSLQGHDFSGLLQAQKPGDLGSYCSAHLYYCPRCRRSGYLNLETHLHHYHLGEKNSTSDHPESRLVYSARLNADEIQVLQP